MLVLEPAGLLQNVQHEAREIKLVLKPTQTFPMNLVCIVLFHGDCMSYLKRARRRFYQALIVFKWGTHLLLLTLW